MRRGYFHYTCFSQSTPTFSDSISPSTSQGKSPRRSRPSEDTCCPNMPWYRCRHTWPTKTKESGEPQNAPPRSRTRQVCSKRRSDNRRDLHHDRTFVKKTDKALLSVWRVPPRPSFHYFAYGLPRLPRGGSSMSPRRRFAKQIIVLSIAIILATFDVEPLG